MPANKSQHYVPQVYLRAFALNGCSAINIVNHSSEHIIHNASIKHQCAKDYFYGNDGKIEGAMQPMEGAYGQVLKRIQRGHIANSDFAFLNEFAYLLHSRTESSIRRGKEVRQEMHRLTYAGLADIPTLDVSQTKIVRDGIRLYTGSRKMIADLRVCILINDTEVDFITSDDPVVLTGRYQNQRLDQRFFGIGSAGVAMFMPITPRLVMMSYDKDVYNPGTSSQFINIKRYRDVLALNELQFIKSQKNAYFQMQAQGEQIREHFKRVEGKWIGYENRFMVHVNEGEKYGCDYFRLATDEERSTPGSKSIIMSIGHPVPSIWPSVLKYKLKPKTYSNGSAAGHLRQATFKQFMDSAPIVANPVIFEPPKK